MVFLSCGNEVFNLSGVHSKGFFTQHIFPSLEEQHANSPVFCMQHSQIYNVCGNTSFFSQTIKPSHPYLHLCSQIIPNLPISGSLASSSYLSLRNTFLRGKIFGTINTPWCNDCNLCITRKKCTHTLQIYLVERTYPVWQRSCTELVYIAYLMISRRQSLNGHTEVMADLSSSTESPSSCHVELYGKWQMSSVLLQ